MLNITALLLGLLVSATSCGVTLAEPAAPTIYKIAGRYSPSYHLAFTLTPENVQLTVPVAERPARYRGSNKYEFSEEGQFEVFVAKTDFPVPAPNCGKWIVLRMPGTDAGQPEGATSLAAKRALFDRIQQLKSGGEKRVNSVIELSPYVKETAEDPLRVELTQCNVFFRQAHNQYVDTVGPLP